MILPKRSRQPVSRTTSGMTLLEVVLTMSVLVVGMMAVSSSSLVSHKLRASNREHGIAVMAVRGVAEELYGLSQQSLDGEVAWGELIEQELVAGGDIGNQFNVIGLDPQEGEATCGSIELVVDETRTDLELGVDLGMPRDLNGDSLVDSNDVSATAMILPIVVRVRWSGQAGDRELVKGLYLMGF